MANDQFADRAVLRCQEFAEWTLISLVALLFLWPDLRFDRPEHGGQDD